MNDGDAENLAAIRARADAATPGPWDDFQWDQDTGGYLPADADFIAHARSDIPFLLARVGQLEAENGALREQREWWMNLAASSAGVKLGGK